MMDHGTTVLDPALRSAESSSAGNNGINRTPPKAATHDDGVATEGHQGHGQGQGQGHDGHQQQQHHPESPETPHSGHGGASSGETPQHDPLHGGNLDDPKRPRACEACRGLKVRCEPDPNNVEGPCKRCKKAGRNCVVTMPTRKRQKKTDSRVAELEKKIDALTASLQARGSSAAPSGGGAGATGASGNSNASMTRDENPYKPRGWGDHGMARSWNTSTAGGTTGLAVEGLGLDPQESHGGEKGRYDTLIPPAAGQKRKMSERGDTPAELAESGGGGRPAPPIQMGSDYADVVERGILSAEKAAELFERYNMHMMPHMPAVVFAAGTTAEETRRSKPLLFLAIMSAASSESPNVQRRLVKELMQIFAEKVIITGEKSLEIVQALQVAVIWYWPPEHFEELKFYQLVHIGAVMALDIGLGRRAVGRKMQIPYQWRNHPFKRAPPPDPASIECRRAWLAAYFLAANTSMALHRPNLVRWTTFMAESMEVLQNSADAAPTDKYFCHLVWTHRLAEEVGIQFSMDDPAVVPNITDSRTQYSLRMLERDLEKYSASVPKEEMQSTLRMSFHVLSLYMHEIALHTQTDDIRPPFDTATLKDGMLTSLTLTTSHINALSACLSAIDGIFDAFLAMEVPSIRCLPVFNFVRVAYAVVVLIKMYFSATAPGSELGRVIDKDNMKVEYYLDALLEKFRAAASDDRSRPAAKFLVVLVMLRSWFLKQSKGPAAGSAAEGSWLPFKGGAAPTPAAAAIPQPGQTAASAHASRPPDSTPTEDQQRAYQPGPSAMQEYPAANTPLHLLSEIATNDRSGRATSNILWNPPQLSARQSFLYDPTAVTPTPLDGPESTGPDTASSGTVDHQPNANAAAAPWLNPAWSGDPQDIGFDMDITGGLSLEEFTTGFGASPGSLTNGMRYVMAQDPWLSGMGGFGDMFEGMPGASGPPMFPM